MKIIYVISITVKYQYFTISISILQSVSVFYNLAIKNKLNETRILKLETNRSGDVSPLSESDTRSLKAHFKKKLAFYSSQNNSTWEEWPLKQPILTALENPRKRMTRRNYKKKKNKNRRAAEKAAKKAIDSGSVLVLVDIEIPVGAIAALGKGLGYVPTPKLDVEGLRLDMRRATNNIITLSKQAMNNIRGGANGEFDK